MNIKIISQSNQGVSIARNNAMKYVDSKYVKFIDGDDFIELNALEKMVNMAEDFNLPIIKTSYQIIKGNFKSKNNYNANFDKTGDIIDLSVNKDWLILENVGIGGKMFKTDCFNGIEFPTFIGDFVPEDLAVIPYVIAKAGMVGVTDLSLVNYRRHSGSLTNSKTRELSAYYIDGLKSLEYLYDLFKNNGLYDEYKEQLAKMDVVYRCIDMLSYTFINTNNSLSDKIKILNNLRTLAAKSLSEFEIDKNLYINKNAIYWLIFMLFCKSILPNKNINIDEEKVKEETRRLLLNINNPK